MQFSTLSRGRYRPQGVSYLPPRPVNSYNICGPACFGGVVWEECLDRYHKHDPHTVSATVTVTATVSAPVTVTVSATVMVPDSVTATKVVSERPFGPVRLVIGDIRGASRPFGCVGWWCGKRAWIGITSTILTRSRSRSRSRTRPTATVTDTATVLFLRFAYYVPCD